MKNYKVKDLMVPISEYATVTKEATLFEAVTALEEAQEKFGGKSYRHRAIIVMDGKHVAGKISMHDALRALEPKYGEMGLDKSTTRLGFSSHFLQAVRENFNLFETPLENICKKAADLNVESFMQIPAEEEFVGINDSVDVAIHKLVMGHHQSFLVTDNKEVAGVLRLTDVFAYIFHSMVECNTS